MADTAQPIVAAETEAVDPIAAAADAFKTFDRSAPALPPRAPDGKFTSANPVEEAPEEIEAEAEAPEVEAEAESQEEPEAGEGQPEEAQPDVELPPSWPSDMAEEWQTLPAPVREKIVAREAERETAVNAKFQEAANLRKAHEAEIEEAKTNRQRFAEAADFLVSVVRPQQPSPSMLDPSSSDYNPDAYHLANRKYEEQVQLLNAVAQQRQQIAQQESEAEQTQREARIAEINSKHMPDLVKLVPDFTDQSKADAAFHGLARYALSQGVPEDTELSAFTAVELKLLAKAQKYDEMMAAKAKVTPKAPKPAAPVVKPGVATPRATIQAQRQKEALNRLDKSGSIEDAAAFFLTHTRK